MEPVQMNEGTPLLGVPKKSDTRESNKKYAETVGCGLVVHNCFANLFSCGSYKQKHQLAFNAAVTQGQLEQARVHYQHGAQIDLTHQAVKDVIDTREQKDLIGFLAVNAKNGNWRQTFDTLIELGLYDAACDMLWKAPIPTPDRVALFAYACTVPKIASKVQMRLGNDATVKISIWQVVLSDKVASIIQKTAYTG